jgi:ABC-2 type transport system permease protein
MSDESVELRVVRGPSALGGGWRRALELLFLIASTEFKRTYFGTALGYVWSVARPLLLFAVLLAVFTQAFHVGSQVAHYPVLLLFNMVLFGFFQEATGTALPSIVSQEAIVRKTQFPRLVIPVSVVLTALFNLGPNLLVVLVFILGFGISPMWTWLLFPVVLVLLIGITTAVAMILSSLFPRFRDLGIIWTVSSTALFYGTPILYALDHVSHTLRDIVSLNPLTPILGLARRWIIDPHAPTPGTVAAGGAARLLVAASIYFATCMLAVWVFNREAPRIAEDL